MKKRIAIVGLYHESNTFSSIPTLWENFADGHIFREAEIIERFQNAHHEIGGFLQVIKGDDVELIPLIVADAIPSGTISNDVVLKLTHELCCAVESALPLDGIYCVAHGAATGEEIRDVDGYWLSEIRAIVGNSVPMIASLDPHANVSQKMANATDAMIAYTTNPHLDQKEVGGKVAKLMKRLLREGLNIKQELIMLPASLSIEQQETAVEPCFSLYKQIASLMEGLPVISHSIILGFPYADVEEMGTSLVLITERNFDPSQLKREIIEVFESYYPQFVGKRILIEEVLQTDLTLRKPVLLLDMGDNVGAGALGNSSYLFHALEMSNCSSSIIVIYDPVKVDYLRSFSRGNKTEIYLDDDTGGHPLKRYVVEILEIKDGEFKERSPRHGGQTSYDMGKVVLARTELGNYIVFTSKRVPPFSSQQLQIFNIDLSQLNWIVAKGVNAPIAAYKDICPNCFKIQTPGESNADATHYHYQYRTRPMIPFETLQNK